MINIVKNTIIGLIFIILTSIIMAWFLCFYNMFPIFGNILLGITILVLSYIIGSYISKELKTSNIIKEKEIKHIISEIKKKYPDLTIDFYYDPEEDFYIIWHNNHLLDSDDEFAIYISPLITHLHNKKFSNFVIGYDHEKTLELNKQNETQKE